MAVEQDLPGFFSARRPRLTVGDEFKGLHGADSANIADNLESLLPFRCVSVEDPAESARFLVETILVEDV